MKKSLLKLNDNVAIFESNNDPSNIFYDRLNQKIITVKNEGTECIISVKGFIKKDDIEFRIQHKGQIQTINLSSNMKIAAIHRDVNSVDFVFLDQKTKDDNYVIVNKPCKAKTAEIKFVEWVKEDQIVYITSRGLELYQVLSKKKYIKFYRNSDVNIEWAVYYSPSQLFICATGITSGVINPFIVQNGYIHKLQKFEVEFGLSNEKSKLNDKDILVASIYEKLYLLVIKMDFGRLIKQINMYEILNDITKSIELSHILLLNLDDTVDLHTIDNLVIVHHRKTARSCIFDIKLNTNDDNKHLPALSTPIMVNQELKTIYHDDIFKFYPWFILPPNQIVDTEVGILSEIILQLEYLWEFFDNKDNLLRFIMNRTKHEMLMLEVIQKLLLDKSLKLTQVAKVFQEIYLPERSFESILSPIKYDSFKFKIITEEYKPMTVDQKSIINSVFSPLGENQNMDKKWLSNALLEFLLILKQHKVIIDHYLPELLVMVMSQAGEYSRLQQIFQHKVIDDSKFLAFKLIEMSKSHLPLFQLAMDMLARRGNNSHIVGFLLEKGQIIDAMRAIKEPIDEQTCIKLLDAAKNTNNRQTKYTVYHYLHDILKLPFFDLPLFEKYSKEFKMLFDTKELIEAETRFRLARISSTPIPLHSMTPDTNFELSLSSSLRD